MTISRPSRGLTAGWILQPPVSTHPRAGSAVVTHPLVFPGGQRHRRRDGDREVAGVPSGRRFRSSTPPPPRIGSSSNSFPAVNRFLDRHVGAGRAASPAPAIRSDLVVGISQTQPAHGARPRTTTGRPSSATRLTSAMVKHTLGSRRIRRNLGDDIQQTAAGPRRAGWRRNRRRRSTTYFSSTPLSYKRDRCSARSATRVGVDLVAPRPVGR